MARLFTERLGDPAEPVTTKETMFHWTTGDPTFHRKARLQPMPGDDSSIEDSSASVRLQSVSANLKKYRSQRDCKTLSQLKNAIKHG